jgi:hypothetical protein
MTWVDYRNGVNKTKVHVGFDIARGIPHKVTLTSGKTDEKPQKTLKGGPWPAEYCLALLQVLNRTLLQKITLQLPHVSYLKRPLPCKPCVFHPSSLQFVSMLSMSSYQIANEPPLSKLCYIKFSCPQIAGKYNLRMKTIIIIVTEVTDNRLLIS